MLIEVKVPQLSESVAEATLVSWHKQAGEAVVRDENLIDIETDKVVLELPAPADGVLVKLLKENGATVTSGEVIAHLDTEATAGKPAAAEKKAGAQPAAASPVPAPAPAATAAKAAAAPTVMP
ncbi:MAG TPA: biotin/lipoyl-containing protein, partial [Rhodocyclaceae bacterium]|nr:biotin/lipoyl-containing protein [Rhodocyclaceae bacterium]